MDERERESLIGLGPLHLGWKVQHSTKYDVIFPLFEPFIPFYHMMYSLENRLCNNRAGTSEMVSLVSVPAIHITIIHDNSGPGIPRCVRPEISNRGPVT